ncbi:fructose-bisphosphate aldolase [Leifsonia xyli subsp. xyli]|uniref:Tagatose-bisphosphate aldolase n=2 Tax=Leifsonia xyli subsp. xyli TaxID=59736 RepID=Q6AD90_LEIXX|nr:class II fructose-bisphosphate aldolase [Leifsonia xyli]AAT89654.1 tagatose-bisphosphate aldolase [Leifsonia xyli subsp. xyli str. CTCB07]ODA91240.1 fructose-bisphosphate aldolase [Leifsonia xyli subsp. xyli]
MPLVPTLDLLRRAVAHRTGLAAFNVIHLETAEALLAAAEETGLPIVLQISQNCVKYHGSLEPIEAATLAAAAGSSASAAVHLDHAEDEELTRRAIDLGFGSVMFDGAALAYERNVAATVRVVEHAHANEVSVEAELGEIGGKDGVHAPGVRTEPDEAQRFVTETGVDSLAVAVGSSHAMTERTARLDLGLVAALRQAVPVPLVLHGSSGAADETIEAAIRAGITKVNVSTHLNRSFTAGVRGHLAANPGTVDSRTYLREGRTAMTAEAARLMRLFDVTASAVEERDRTKETAS